MKRLWTNQRPSNTFVVPRKRIRQNQQTKAELMKNSNRFGFMHCLFIAAFAAALSYFILSKVLGQSSILTTMEMEYIPVVLSVIVGINVFMFILKFERKPIDSQTTGSKPVTSTTTDTD